ncbi:DUF397 domain-containing protein [Streptomyces noursei]|uniref:DUF397 domain-containing protein n=1 Tax=Streptomyces noursei TaxID=1971 RepID=UPI0023B79B44|nr:DUF397 domain-containing protein [Streptomyces noursei]
MNTDLTGAVWKKSSYSGDNSQCVEVAHNLPGIVPVRDSKAPEGPVLVFSPASFSAFVHAIRETRQSS